MRLIRQRVRTHSRTLRAPRRSLSVRCCLPACLPAGIFTAGGTFCNMYGMLLGLRRAFPDSVRRGVPQQEDYRFICSHAGHYSNATVLSTMGINVQKRIVSVPITLHNDMDMAALREALESCFRLGVTVPAILLTMGTTDTFAGACACARAWLSPHAMAARSGRH